MSLAILEQQFQALVLERTPGIERAIAGTARVPVEVRLAIYYDAYRARLTEALQANYPMLAQLLGDGQFGALARLYIERHPSRHFSIRWFGGQLGDLLADTEPYRNQALLSELACWEWAMNSAFDAAHAPVLTAAMLAQHAADQWGELCFTVQPSMQLLSLHTNAPAVWRALSRQETPPPPEWNSTACGWTLWRQGLDTLFRSLSTAEAQALHAVRAGASFAAVCELLANEIGEDAAAAEAARMLAGWLAEERLSDVRVPPSSGFCG